MTAIRITQTIRALRFSVVGQDAAGSTAVRHVGLLFLDDDLDAGREVRVVDMAPPLRLGAPEDTMVVHTVGYVEVLTPEQQRRMDYWLADLHTQGVDYKFRVQPASGEVIEPGTQRVQYRFYSCAGLVADCYARAGVLLVDQSALPLVTRALALEIWGKPLSPPALERALRELGLEGQGPWRLLLPGYLLHALDAPPEKRPYVPRQDDWRYP